MEPGHRAHRGHGHRRGGAQTELASAVVQLAGDIQIEEPQRAARLAHHLLDEADRRDHVVAGPLLDLHRAVLGTPVPGPGTRPVQGGADAAGVLGGGDPRRDEAVDRDQHRLVAGLDDGVLAAM